jgi:acyl-CoA synthetase (AMP-forming)/AMP-acid ligase II
MILHSQEHIQAYTAAGWWSTRTIRDVWDEQVNERPDAAAVSDPLNRGDFTDGSAGKWSFAQMDQLANRMASAFAQVGIGQDDVVAVQLPNVGELVAVYIAALKLGAIVSPFPVQYRENELVQLLDFVEAKAIVTTCNMSGRHSTAEAVGLKGKLAGLKTVFSIGDSAPAGSIDLSAMLTAEAESIAQATLDANSVYTICWTSGTERMPKGVPRTHNDWLMIARAVYDGAELNQSDQLLCPFPIVNMAGIGGMFLPWMKSGGHLVLHHPFDMPTFFKQVVLNKATYTVLPPAALNLLLMRKEMLAQADISSIKQIGSGSAPLTPWMVAGWQEKGIMVTNFFGANEGTALLSSPQDFPDPEKRALFFPRFGVEGLEWSSGVADGMKTRLVDLATGETITEAGRPGEMRITGPTIFSGYFKGDEIGLESFDDHGYFKTGDMFEIAGEGDDARYYRFVDRVKDIIIRGGVNISAAEVEGLIQGHPDIAEVAAVGYPDTVMGEKTCVFVVPQEGAEPSLDGIITHMSTKNVAKFKLPERMETIAALPRNPVGKILKRELREKLRANS